MKIRSRWIGIWAVAVAMAVGLCAGCLADAKLDISESQKDQLKALASNTRDRISRERDALRRARMELLQAYSTYDIDERKARAACDRVSSGQLSLLNVHLDNEVALRGILTSDQFQAFREMMKRRMRDPRMHLLAPPEEAMLDRLPDSRMLDSMGLSAEQRRRLDATSRNSGTVEGLRDASKQLLQFYLSYSLDSATARKVIDSIHRKQVYLLTLQNQRQIEIRRILSEDQFKKLQQEIAKRMAERGPRRDRNRHRRP